MDFDSPWMQQCLTVCLQPKYLGEQLEWLERPNHTGSVAARSIVLDSDRVAIPGLNFQGEVQFRTYGNYQKYGLLYKEGGKALRVLTLEVYPRHILSHRGDEDIYGPHIHLGDERGAPESQTVRQVRCSLDPAQLASWIERFRRHARMSDNPPARLVPPFSDELFQ